MHGCSYLWLGSFLLDMEGMEGKEKLLGGSIQWQSSKIKTFFCGSSHSKQVWQSLLGHLQIQLYVLCMVFAWYVQLDASNCQLPTCLKAGTKRTTRKSIRIRGAQCMNSIHCGKWIIEAPVGKAVCPVSHRILYSFKTLWPPKLRMQYDAMMSWKKMEFLSSVKALRPSSAHWGDGSWNCLNFKTSKFYLVGVALFGA